MVANNLPSEVALSIVVPTFNEAGNVAQLVDKLHAALTGVTTWEVIFVDDDSPDGTSQVLENLARQCPQVRRLRRIGRRGLSGACIEGMLSSSARYLAVMDADLQHDETKLDEMFRALDQEGFDLAVGTRYMEGGSVGQWQARRLQTSQAATWLSHKVLGLTIKDPMSGFFMLRKSVLDEAVYRLSGVGFKILVDLLASSPAPLRIKVIPYHFGQRVAGESKLDDKVVWDYLMLLADKKVGHILPVQLISFAAVGSTGVLVHLAVLSLFMALFQTTFGACQKFCVQGITFHQRSIHASPIQDSRSERQSGPAATQPTNARRAHPWSGDQRAIH